MTPAQQYNEDFAKLHTELTPTVVKLICAGCQSPGSAAAVIALSRSVLSAVLTYAADGNESLLLDLIDTVSKELRSKTADLSTAWKEEVKKRGQK